jgi:ribA/ribD-fused uncharacterized protein
MFEWPDGETPAFRGDRFFCSNMLIAPVEVDGVTYRCSEAAYVAHKIDPAHPERDKWLAQLSEMSGSDAKRFGRRIPVRADWDTIKTEVMLKVVTAKFEQNPRLARKLIETGDEVLVERNNWNDTFWGVCNGNGLNKLGSILMVVRSKLVGE